MTSQDQTQEALSAIMAEWTSSNDYNTRFANLMAMNVLDSIFEDLLVDTLTGNDGNDLIFSTPILDKAPDRKNPQEHTAAGK